MVHDLGQWSGSVLAMAAQALAPKIPVVLDLFLGLMSG